VDKDQLKTPENFDKKLNGRLHEGPASFSNKDTYMAFTRIIMILKGRIKLLTFKYFLALTKTENGQKRNLLLLIIWTIL